MSRLSACFAFAATVLFGCSQSGREPSSSGGGGGDTPSDAATPAPPHHYDAAPPPPPAPPLCTSSVMGYCAAAGSRCVTAWSNASTAATWCSRLTSADGWLQVSSSPCGGYDIASYSAAGSGGEDFYYDPTRGALVAVVAWDDQSTTCLAGPAGFVPADETKCSFSKLRCTDAGTTGDAGTD